MNNYELYFFNHDARQVQHLIGYKQGQYDYSGFLSVYSTSNYLYIFGLSGLFEEMQVTQFRIYYGPQGYDINYYSKLTQN